MATIKDVAKEANVSIGTVSNVINGKTNNEELIRRVENAIEKLDFRLNGKAKSLKMKCTYLIGVVVENLENAETGLILEALERRLENEGYSLVIKMAGKNAVLEKKQISQLMKTGVDGMIIMTGNSNKKWEKLVDGSNIPVVLLDKCIMKSENISVIYIDYKRAVDRFFRWCEKNGYKKIAMILGTEVLDSESIAEIVSAHSKLQVHYRLVGNYPAEAGFKATCELLYENEVVDVIFIGNKCMESGVFQAARMLGYEEAIHYVCAKNGKWLEDENRYEGIIDLSFLKQGEEAAKKILESLKSGKRQMTIGKIEAEFKEIAYSLNKSGKRKLPEYKKSLTVAILNPDTAKVLKEISDIYELETDVHIIYHCLEYHDLWNIIVNPERIKGLKIDIFMYDILWKDSLIQRNLLKDISELEENEEYFEDYIEGIVDICGRRKGKLYGLPFLTGTQLLFYQRDLFVDEAIQIQFQRMYGYKLEVPKTQDEYLNVARFFTREFNPKSPVQYGSAMINQGNLYNSIEFLNRLWTYNADIIRNGYCYADTAEFRVAVEKYKELYQYTRPEARITSWEDLAEEFKNGKTAMIQLYDSYAYDLNNYEHSKVAGNIECATVAGKCPVTGGWGLGIYEGSSNQEQAQEFVKWVCGPAYDKLYSVLAGISNRKNFYENKDLELLYPWKKRVLESYRISKNRRQLSNIVDENANMMFYDRILGKTICDMVLGKIAIEEGIKKIQEETEKIQAE